MNKNPDVLDGAPVHMHFGTQSSKAMRECSLLFWLKVNSVKNEVLNLQTITKRTRPLHGFCCKVGFGLFLAFRELDELYPVLA